jgi:hypothetical protein
MPVSGARARQRTPEERMTHVVTLAELRALEEAREHEAAVAPPWETSPWPFFLGVGILFAAPLAFSLYFVYQKPLLAVLALGIGVPLVVASIVGSVNIGALIILWSWIHGLLRSAKAPANPWGSRSLEWTTPLAPAAQPNDAPRQGRLREMLAIPMVLRSGDANGNGSRSRLGRRRLVRPFDVGQTLSR